MSGKAILEYNPRYQRRLTATPALDVNYFLAVEAVRAKVREDLKLELEKERVYISKAGTANL